MTVPARVVAFSEERRIFFVGKCADMQAMRSAERDLHSEKDIFVIPNFGEKISPLMKPDAVKRKRSGHAFANVTSQTFRRYRTAF